MLKTNPLPQDGTTNLETFELTTISSASVIINRRSAQTPRRSINPGNPPNYKRLTFKQGLRLSDYHTGSAQEVALRQSTSSGSGEGTASLFAKLISINQ